MNKTDNKNKDISKKIDIDSPREKYFGWFPKEKPAQIMFLVVLVYYLVCMFTWTAWPQEMVFGWWPAPFFAYCFVYIPIFVIILTTYYYKFWPELKKKDK